jgi:hypothetical protein
MYKIPEEFDIKQFEGAAVQQVAFSINTISIQFERLGYLSMEGSFSFSIKGKVYHYENIYPVANDFRLLELLEKKVIEVKIDESRENLTFLFEAEIMLTAEGSKNFESYHLKIGEIKITV